MKWDQFDQSQQKQLPSLLSEVEQDSGLAAEIVTKLSRMVREIRNWLHTHHMGLSEYVWISGESKWIKDPNLFNFDDVKHGKTHGKGSFPPWFPWQFWGKDPNSSQLRRLNCQAPKKWRWKLKPSRRMWRSAAEMVGDRMILKNSNYIEFHWHVCHDVCF